MGNCECVRLKGNSLKTQNYLDLNAVSHCAHLRLSELQENASWSYSTQAELKLHRIHAYPAKFPAFITTRALDFAQDDGLRVRLLADIFCGCGTVAFEARRNSIDFWGCDINPIATLIARTKSGSYQQTRLQGLRHLKREGYRAQLDTWPPSGPSPSALRCGSLGGSCTASSERTRPRQTTSALLMLSARTVYAS